MENIESAKQKLKQAQLEIIEVYLDRISQTYKSLPDEKIGGVVNGLESIVSVIENEIPAKPKRKPDLSPFNKSEAKILRVKMDLTQIQLAQRLGFSQGCLVKYEKGSVIPNPYKQGKQENGRKYLEFLKEQGYNPFNI